MRMSQELERTLQGSNHVYIVPMDADEAEKLQKLLFAFGFSWADGTTRALFLNDFGHNRMAVNSQALIVGGQNKTIRKATIQPDTTDYECVMTFKDVERGMREIFNNFNIHQLTIHPDTRSAAENIQRLLFAMGVTWASHGDSVMHLNELEKTGTGFIIEPGGYIGFGSVHRETISTVGNYKAPSDCPLMAMDRDAVHSGELSEEDFFERYGQAA